MSEDSVEKFWLLLLGVLLGLLCPAIVDAIRRQREVVPVRKALLGELHELKYRLACAGRRIEERFGVVDRSYLQWFRSVVVEYEGNKPKDSILEFVDAQLNLTDEEIALDAKRKLADSGGGLELKKYLVPLLDSRIPSLWFFESRFQHLLLDVRAELNLLNEEVDEARYYSRLTFTKLEGDNQSRVESNLIASYRQIARRAKITVDKISELEKCE